jgi:hypothetical protein
MKFVVKYLLLFLLGYGLRAGTSLNSSVSRIETRTSKLKPKSKFNQILRLRSCRSSSTLSSLCLSRTSVAYIYANLPNARQTSRSIKTTTRKRREDKSGEHERKEGRKETYEISSPYDSARSLERDSITVSILSQSPMV